jgi:DNA invertase Pin-like site-specific DNA recombinase
MTDRLYARISLDNERSGSITKQRARLAKFAEGSPEWYVDESVSAAKIPFADRPEGGRLLADLRKGDRLLVTKIDRAARNVTDLLGLVARVEETGAALVFVDQNIDTSGPMGRFLLTLLGAVAELEAAIVAERVRETRESFRTEGRFGGGPIPVGFVTAPHPAGRGLVLRPDPATAPLVREVVDRVLAGEPQRLLAPLLGLGEPGFSRYLRNPVLAGIRADGDLTVDPDAAILSLSKWDDLQTYLARPAKAWTRADGYGAALRCASCGERLYFARNRRYPDSSVYRCARRLHADGDPAVAVVRRLADERIEGEFLGRFGALPVIERVRVSSSGERAEAVARARLKIEAVRRAQDEAETEEDDDRLAGEYRAARAALRAAEALPEEVVEEERPTGLTFAQAWEQADDTARSDLLLRFGPWIVEPGRLPIEEKIYRGSPAPDYFSAVDYGEGESSGPPGAAEGTPEALLRG